MTLPALAPNEAAFAVRWAAGARGGLRVEDGRRLRVVFPGLPGGSAGPDFRDALLDLDGDLLRGDVELHLRASGWRAHGHHTDLAYGRVVLHVVERNDSGGATTLHHSGRAIPLLVLPPPRQGQAFPPPFTPPCALRGAQGADSVAILARLGLRRLRAKAARWSVAAGRAGAGPALYAALFEYAAGPANRAAFAMLAARLPLPALLDRAAGAEDHARALAAELRGAAAALILRRVGVRPMASPVRRLDSLAALIARLWPATASPAWPVAAVPASNLVRLLSVPGIGRSLAIELAANAVLPVALASGEWLAADVEAAFATLPSPGTYGRLKLLGGWLEHGGSPPFASAQGLQGGLLLHAEYCSRGYCGRCPLSGGPG